MATAPPAPIHWIPEDDLLLKNAVEVIVVSGDQAGASLEALAKGAVQFSRRFTFQELRDRWYSILYDPEVSAQASARMFELEISGFNLSSKLNRPENNLKGNKEVPRKRKAETIRRKYYAMRKRLRSELFSNSDLGLFEPNPHEFSANTADYQKGVTLNGTTLAQNCMLGDNISGHLGLQEEDLDILRHAFPETMRDVEVVSCTTSVPQGGCANSFEDTGIIRNYGFNDASTSLAEGEGRTLEENMRFASDQPQLCHWGTIQDVSDAPVPVVAMSSGDPALLPDVEGRENSSATYTGEFADPDSLLNLSNEDDILLIVDLDEKQTEDNSSTDNIDPVLVDSLKDIQENDVKVDVENVAFSENKSVIASNENVGLEVSASLVEEEQRISFQSEANVPSNSSSGNDIAELTDGTIICTLNTEDPEIPCNDDIFLLIHPSTSFGSSATHPSTTVSMDASGSAHEKINQEAVNSQAKFNDSTRLSVWPQKPGIHGLPESPSGSPLLGHAAKPEMHESRPQPVVAGIVNKTIGDSSKGKSVLVIPKVSNDRVIEKDIAGISMRARDSTSTVTEIVQSHEVDPGRILHPEPAVDSSDSDEEESNFGCDIPYFSDIEAMILEMDLEPYDQDSQVLRQVPSYQYDDTKRTIIRLEQAARSCLERAMTSRGALAIFYGRHMKHYIRKPEVLLGRSTEDVDVDIDLRKEGRANKISRRQAIIRMEADGSFFLKNLGKSSVSVNGVTVATGQLLALSPSCLIEIKGMSFIFEINQRYVRKHLGNFCPNDKGKTVKSDSSADNKQ